MTLPAALIAANSTQPDVQRRALRGDIEALRALAANPQLDRRVAAELTTRAAAEADVAVYIVAAAASPQLQEQLLSHEGVSTAMLIGARWVSDPTAARLLAEADDGLDQCLVAAARRRDEGNARRPLASWPDVLRDAYLDAVEWFAATANLRWPLDPAATIELLAAMRGTGRDLYGPADDEIDTIRTRVTSSSPGSGEGFVGALDVLAHPDCDHVRASGQLEYLWRQWARSAAGWAPVAAHHLSAHPDGAAVVCEVMDILHGGSSFEIITGLCRDVPGSAPHFAEVLGRRGDPSDTAILIELCAADSDLIGHLNLRNADVGVTSADQRCASAVMAYLERHCGADHVSAAVGILESGFDGTAVELVAVLSGVTSAGA